MLIIMAPVKYKSCRTQVKKVMQPYRSMTGAFLVRPSSTEEGSLTLSVV